MLTLSSLDVLPLHTSAKPLLAEVCLTLNSCICIEGIKLIQGKSRVYLKWPNTKSRSKYFKNPIFREGSGIDIGSKLFKGQVQSLIWTEYCRKVKRKIQKVGQVL
jgi:DNA-binding cell septation regulator SpoVG